MHGSSLRWSRWSREQMRYTPPEPRQAPPVIGRVKATARIPHREAFPARRLLLHCYTLKAHTWECLLIKHDHPLLRPQSGGTEQVLGGAVLVGRVSLGLETYLEVSFLWMESTTI